MGIRLHVALNVLVQVRLLSEAQTAAERATEGSLTRVDAKVVVEVVELAEELGAALKVALQNLEGPFGLRVLVLENSKFFLQLILAELGAGTQLEDFPQLVGQDLAALLDLNSGHVLRDLSLDVRAADHRAVLPDQVSPIRVFFFRYLL